MKKKELVDFIVGLLLMFLAVCIILLPTFKITNIKIVLLTIFGFYTIFKIVSFILIYKEKDYESLFTSLVSGSSLIATSLIELTTKNIALILMIWMGLMSLIKLKKANPKIKNPTFVKVYKTIYKRNQKNKIITML